MNSIVSHDEACAAEWAEGRACRHQQGRRCEDWGQPCVCTIPRRPPSRVSDTLPKTWPLDAKAVIEALEVKEPASIEPRWFDWMVGVAIILIVFMPLIMAVLHVGQLAPNP